MEVIYTSIYIFVKVKRIGRIVFLTEKFLYFPVLLRQEGDRHNFKRMTQPLRIQHKLVKTNRSKTVYD